MDGWVVFISFKYKVVTLGEKQDIRSKWGYMDSANSWFYKLQQRKEYIRKSVFHEVKKEYP